MCTDDSRSRTANLFLAIKIAPCPVPLNICVEVTPDFGRICNSYVPSSKGFD